MALKSDGSIVSWGSDWEGSVADTPSGPGFSAIAAGGNYSMALRSDGSIFSWGSDHFGQVSGTPSGTGFTAVATAGGHNLALQVPEPSGLVLLGMGAAGLLMAWRSKVGRK